MNEVKKPKKPLIYYYFIVLLVIVLFNLLLMPRLVKQQIKETDYGTFMTMTEEENIGRVEIQDNQILFTDKADNVARQAGIQTADTLGFRGRQCCDRRNNVLRDTDRALIAFGGPVLLVICHSAHSPFLRQSHHPALSKSIIAQFV